MNSWTSRPRSPIKPMTLMSASQLRAIIPSSVLLPTPEPAKMPNRWPLPQVSIPSRARTPVASGVLIGCRPSGLGGASVMRAVREVWSGPLPSIGRARPSITRPRSSSPTGTAKPLPLGKTAVPGRTPWVSANGIRISRSSRNPTTSAVMREAPAVARSGYRWQISPSGKRSPSTSMLRPTTWTTRPWKRSPDERAINCRCALRSSIGILHTAGGLCLHHEGPQRVAQLLELGRQLRVNLTVGGLDDPATGLDSLVGLQLDALGADAGWHNLSPTPLQQLRILRADARSNRVHCQVRHVFELALDHLPRDLECQVDDLPFGGAIERGVVFVDAAQQG